MIVGVDIDTFKLTLCWYGDGVLAWQTAELRKRGDGAKLFGAILAIPGALARAIERAEVRPTEVYIERGFGASRKADFDLGAIYGATALAFGRVVPGVHVGPMAMTTWKKSLTAAAGMKTAKGDPGLGNCKKEVANSAARQVLMAEGCFPEQPLTPDQLDAFGIAYAARHA